MSTFSYISSANTEAAVIAQSQFRKILNSKLLMPSGIFVFALLINLVTIWHTGFDGLYGQDAYSYFAHAGELRFHLSLFHHWQWEAGPRLLFWPTGYPAVVALFFSVTGASAGVAQLVSILAWAGAAGLLSSLGRQLSGNFLAGLVAGGLLTLSPLGRQLAISIMSDALAVFWTVLAAWLVIKARESTQDWVLLLAGFALGTAIITRYAAAVALPLLLLGAVWPLSNKHRLSLKWLVLAVAAVGIVYLPQFVINQLYPASFWNDSWLTDWSPLNAMQNQFNTRDGFASYPMSPLIFYLGYTLLNLHLLTPMLLPLVGFGLLYLWQKGRRFELVWLTSWWMLAVVFLSSIPYESERFTLTYLPPLVLLGGLGVAGLAQWQAKIFTHYKAKVHSSTKNSFFWQHAQQVILITLLAAGAGGLGVLSQHHVDGFMASKTSDLAVVTQVEHQLPTNATLLTFDLSLTFDHYTSLKIRDLSFEDTNSIAILASEPSVYLLVDVQNMQQQWAGHPVGNAFEAALSHAENAPLGRFGRYTLWKLH